MEHPSSNPLEPPAAPFSSSQTPLSTNLVTTGPPYLSSSTDAFPPSYGYTSPTTANSASAVNTKPAKRKRLAKACDACHKSKRRCDGTSPCANCDFAGKICTYTDPSGRAVAPPRARVAGSQSAANQESWPPGTRAPIESPPTHRSLTPVPSASDVNVSPLDPALTRELVSLFFAHCHPSSFLLHRPTFLYDLSRSQVPNYLLLAVFTIAAPYSLQPSLRTDSPWHAGERFAIEAFRTMFYDNPHSPNLPDSLDSLRIKPCLELAQALCLLQAHDCVMRRPSKTDRLLLRALDVLHALEVMDMDLPLNPMTHATFVRNEAMRRTFWYINYIELLSSAFTGRALSTRGEHLSRLRLPIEEALFELPRISQDVTSHFLPLPRDRRVCHGEFANMIRVSVIYAGVMNKAVEKLRVLQSWDRIETPLPALPSVTELENDLRRWLELLPDHLRLTEDNLQCHLSMLDGGSGSAAWCFTYMHALAECTVLALHEFMDLGTESKSPRNLAAREQKALENLTMILGALGQRGRANLMMATLLLAVGKHCSVQHPQIASWFEEYYRMWGVSLDQLMNDQFRAAWCSVDLSCRSPSPHAAGSERPPPIVGSAMGSYDFDRKPPAGFGLRKRKMSPTGEHLVGGQMGRPTTGFIGGRVGPSDKAGRMGSSQVYGQQSGDGGMGEAVNAHGSPGRTIIGPTGPSVVNGMLAADMGLMSEETSGLGALAVAAGVNGSPHNQEMQTYLPPQMNQHPSMSTMVTSNVNGVVTGASVGSAYPYSTAGQMSTAIHDDSDSRSGSGSPEALKTVHGATSNVLNGGVTGSLAQASFERGHHQLHSSQSNNMLVANSVPVVSHSHHHHLSGASMAYHSSDHGMNLHHGGWIGEEGTKMRETVR